MHCMIRIFFCIMIGFTLTDFIGDLADDLMGRRNTANAPGSSLWDLLYYITIWYIWQTPLTLLVITYASSCFWLEFRAIYFRESDDMVSWIAWVTMRYIQRIWLTIDDFRTIVVWDFWKHLTTLHRWLREHVVVEWRGL